MKRFVLIGCNCLQGNLGEHPFNAPSGPVFNPGTGFGSRSNIAFGGVPQDFANTQGFASSASLNLGPSPVNLTGNVNSISSMNLGLAAGQGGGNPYHSVYNMSPNSIPLGAGRPLLNGIGF